MYVAWVRLGGQQIIDQICLKLLNMTYIVFGHKLLFSYEQNPNILVLIVLTFFFIFIQRSIFVF